MERGRIFASNVGNLRQSTPRVHPQWELLHELDVKIFKMLDRNLDKNPPTYFNERGMQKTLK